MRFVPTRIHGYIDYLTAIVLIVMPWAGGFAANGAETWVPVVLGLGIVGYSLCTDYECSVRRDLPMTTHLALDAGGGALLAVSPWLFGFADRVWVPFVVIGLFEIAASLMTQTSPSAARTGMMRGAAGRI